MYHGRLTPVYSGFRRSKRSRARRQASETRSESERRSVCDASERCHRELTFWLRMKCLEFLYFYLMDETPADVRSEGSPTHSSRPVASSSSQTAHPRSSSSLTCVSDSSNFSDFESWSPAPTIASTPPQSPTKANKAREPHSRLGMLKRDVDFVPMSPKKAQVAQLGIGKRRDTKQPNRGRVPSPLGPTSSCDTRIEDDEDRVDDPVGSPTHQTRSTEDKKRILGQLLGNVDALVEGVKKAGIWGLAE